MPHLKSFIELKTPYTLMKTWKITSFSGRTTGIEPATDGVTVHCLHRLRDGFIRRQSLAAVADAHVRRVRLRERVCDFPNSLGPRRREHQRLTSGGAHLQNLLDLGFESHVKHPVRLVEHHVVRVARAHGRGEPGGRR